MYGDGCDIQQNELMKLGDAFEYFDKKKDGVITFEDVILECLRNTQFRDALMTLRTSEQFSNNASLFSITTDETKLRQLFHDIDFDDCGYINYSEFVAACLARKEGLRREYAELIFRL